MMIISPNEDFIISSLGWVDKNNLWILKPDTELLSSVPISNAKSYSLHNGHNGYFSVIHHYDVNRTEITIHSFYEPQKILSRAVITLKTSHFEGDIEKWKYVPNVYIIYFKKNSYPNYYLLLIEINSPALKFFELSWFDDSYDKGYQGVMSVIKVPDRNMAIVSVQRNSKPVLIDLETGQMIMKLSLAERYGNPMLYFCRDSSELWASDYDTLVCLDSLNWTVKNSMQLQDAPKNSRLFIGDFTFNKEETLCAVARPFSGDVVILEKDSFSSFRLIYYCSLGDQPLSVTLLSNGAVYSRDWKTGKLLKGKIKN